MKTVKIQKVRARAAVLDKESSEAKHGIGRVIEVNAAIAQDKELLKREGYVIVSESVVDKAENNAEKDVVDNRDEIKISKSARKLIEEYSLDISSINGTGRNGAITINDVKKVINI